MMLTIEATKLVIKWARNLKRRTPMSIMSIITPTIMITCPDFLNNRINVGL